MKDTITKITLRVPEDTYSFIVEETKRTGLSMNSVIINTLDEKRTRYNKLEGLIRELIIEGAESILEKGSI